MFLLVGIVQSTTQTGKSRILIKTDSVSDLLDKFIHAHYVNALLQLTPASGIVCIPSALKGQITFQACEKNNSYKQIPTLLKLLDIPYEISPASLISISCTEVDLLITQHKHLCLQYITEAITNVDDSITIDAEEINVIDFSPSPNNITRMYSQNLCESTPAVTFRLKRDSETLELLYKMHPNLLMVTTTGYRDVEPIMPCGIKVNSIFDIPVFLKDTLLSKMQIAIQSARTSYLDSLLTFKSRTGAFVVPSLPYEVSKMILLQICDDCALLTEQQKDSHLDKIRDYRLH